MFEDLDEKVELDLLHERASAGIDDAMSDKKLGDKMTIEQVKYKQQSKTVETVPSNFNSI